VANPTPSPAPDPRPLRSGSDSPAAEAPPETPAPSAYDWQRSIEAARAQANAALAQIRTAVASRFPKS
jgi:outer membrane protein TolC